MARDKPTDPQPRGKSQDGRSLTSNVAPTPMKLKNEFSFGPSSRDPILFMCIFFQHTFQIICSVEPASLYILVNETNFVNDFFLVDFSNFIYKLYMFRTSPRPSSAGITIFIWHFFLSCFLLGNSQASEFYMPTFRNTLFLFIGRYV